MSTLTSQQAATDHLSDAETIRREVGPTLEIAPDEFRRLGHALVDRIAGMLATMPQGPLTPGESPSEVRRALGGAALVAGFLTPVACAIAALGGAAMVLDAGAFAPFTRTDSPLAGALLVTIGVAMACLGPGAFSLDARLFGRREVLIRR